MLILIAILATPIPTAAQSYFEMKAEYGNDWPPASAPRDPFQSHSGWQGNYWLNKSPAAKMRKPNEGMGYRNYGSRAGYYGSGAGGGGRHYHTRKTVAK
jgi:hypothetical protein